MKPWQKWIALWGTAAVLGLATAIGGGALLSAVGISPLLHGAMGAALLGGVGFVLGFSRGQAEPGIVAELRQRARRARVAAAIVLLMILAVIVVGTVAFWYSGPRPSEEMTSQINAIARDLETVIRDEAQHQDELDALQKEIPRVASKIDNLRTELQKLPPQEVARQIDELTFFMQRASGAGSPAVGLGDTWSRPLVDKFISVAERNNDINIATTVATRAGIILLLLFLVRFLVVIYQYSSRLGAYYDGRADAIRIAESGIAPNLLKVVEVFSTEQLDFGRPPRIPKELFRIPLGRRESLSSESSE
jgi:uncharacterized protein YpmB